MANVFRRGWVQVLLVAIVLAVVIIVGCHERQGQPQPSVQPTYTVGLVTWIGYAPAYVAKERGMFDAEGIKVDLRNMDQPGSRESAFATGQLDFFPNTPDAFVILFSEQSMSGKIISALDQSHGADGLIAKKEISSVADLKGKTVGFQKGITSHFLLLYFLNQAGLTGADIKQVNMGADDAGMAFMQGNLDAAATWEPWISKARQSTGSRVLADSSQIGDRIVDVVLVSDRVAQNPETGRAFMRAWYKALDFIKTNPEEAYLIIAKNLQVKPEEVFAMLQTTRFYTQAESQNYLKDRLSVVATEISDLYQKEKIIHQPASLKDKIDTQMISN
jgi:NitT/TauT family transport system substrate-binding protein